MAKKQPTPKHESKAEPFDYSKFEQEAIAGLYEGRDLVGSDGVLTAMIQRIINAALSGEVNAHIKESKALGAENRRNGFTEKTLDTTLGPVTINPPRDRNGDFEPKLVGKWDRRLGTGLDKQILYLYAQGNSYNDIQKQLQKIYGLDISTAAISEITDQIWPEITTWQQRPLQSSYTVIYLDGIYFTSREGGKSSRKVFYTVFGIDSEGNRDVLSLYLGSSEAASEWAKILKELKSRGVEEVFFFCVDGLKGMAEAIWQEFPISIVQRCIIHMIRNSCGYVGAKDMKEVCTDLKLIYTAMNEAQASIALESFKVKWGSKYGIVVRQWEENWSELVPFLDYGPQIRRMIYTTNPVESLHRMIRKVTKTKGSWVNDKALIKQIYLLLMHGNGDWNRKLKDWKAISLELEQKFGVRFSDHIIK